jgi:hypothetical protein
MKILASGHYPWRTPYEITIGQLIATKFYMLFLKQVNHQQSQTNRVVNTSKPVWQVTTNFDLYGLFFPSFGPAHWYWYDMIPQERCFQLFTCVSITPPIFAYFPIPPLPNAFMCRAPVYYHTIFCSRFQHCVTNNVDYSGASAWHDIDPWQASTCNLEHLKLQLAVLIFMRL